MVLKHYYSSNIQVAARNLRDKTRDGVMGIGAESFTNRTKIQGKLELAIERLEPQRPPSTHEEDDSEPEVVVVSSSFIPKRKLSIASTPCPRSKRARTVRALTGEPQLSDSESEEDTGEEESEYGDEGEDMIEPEHKQKSAQASEEFASACKKCKANANKALKTQQSVVLPSAANPCMAHESKETLNLVVQSSPHITSTQRYLTLTQTRHSSPPCP